MIYLWCNTHTRKDTGSFVFWGLDRKREQNVPEAEIAANGLMIRKVGWSELNCINADSLATVGKKKLLL